MDNILPDVRPVDWNSLNPEGTVGYESFINITSANLIYNKMMSTVVRNDTRRMMLNEMIVQQETALWKYKSLADSVAKGFK